MYKCRVKLSPLQYKRFSICSLWSHLNVLTFFPSDWGMLRRSRCVQTFLWTTVLHQTLRAKRRFSSPPWCQTPDDPLPCSPSAPCYFPLDPRCPLFSSVPGMILLSDLYSTMQSSGPDHNNLLVRTVASILTYIQLTGGRLCCRGGCGCSGTCTRFLGFEATSSTCVMQWGACCSGPPREVYDAYPYRGASTTSDFTIRAFRYSRPAFGRALQFSACNAWSSSIPTPHRSADQSRPTGFGFQWRHFPNRWRRLVVWRYCCTVALEDSETSENMRTFGASTRRREFVLNTFINTVFSVGNILTKRMWWNNGSESLTWTNPQRLFCLRRVSFINSWTFYTKVYTKKTKYCLCTGQYYTLLCHSINSLRVSLYGTASLFIFIRPFLLTRKTTTNYFPPQTCRHFFPLIVGECPEGLERNRCCHLQWFTAWARWSSEREREDDRPCIVITHENKASYGIWTKDHNYNSVCVFSSHPFWTSSSLDVPAGVTQEEGHTGFLIHLPSAVRALIFVARRIQPFLSLVDREVDFCVLTN